MKAILKKLIMYIRWQQYDVAILNDLNVLNIGAGITRLEFATNIDISNRADVSLNLGVDPLPFDSESVDFIYSDHTVEHVENYLFLISEIHRVLKPGGMMLLGVPYVTLTKYHLVNPYHLHNFNEYSFDFFDPTRLRDSAAEEGDVDLRMRSFHINYLGVFRFLPLIRVVARKYLFNVARDIQFAIIKGPTPLPFTSSIVSNVNGYYSVISSLRKNHEQ